MDYTQRAIFKPKNKLVYLSDLDPVGRFYYAIDYLTGAPTIAFESEVRFV